MSKKQNDPTPVLDAARAIVQYGQGLQGQVWNEIIKDKFAGDKKMIVSLMQDLQRELIIYDKEPEDGEK